MTRDQLLDAQEMLLSEQRREREWAQADLEERAREICLERFYSPGSLEFDSWLEHYNEAITNDLQDALRHLHERMTWNNDTWRYRAIAELEKVRAKGEDWAYDTLIDDAMTQARKEKK